MNTFYLFITFLVFATRKWAQSATTQEIHGWVDGHNNRRLQVAKGEVRGQPSASEMNAVIWDNELYVKAQAYAQTHPKGRHNPDKTVPSGRFTTGESLYRKWTSDRNYKLTPNTAIESWYSEHVNYTYGPLRDSDFDKSKPAIGHYTQLVWSASVYIGCGISETYEGNQKVVYAVCNYGPSGNIIGNTPYKRGGPVRSLTCGCGKKCNNCNNMYGGRN
ncbi:unnamed protein product [Arctia plantaginis]|uniref:SCP domain-containing protein n=1 Tax=Arctia plantaginis TaxID=874455 RepID=A0A8S0ZZB4_ARCPL|nr:unnamed protein product [Arctia plantaginis]CAB3238137.1 unnamed protein product [Arctia plantaginis]